MRSAYEEHRIAAETDAGTERSRRPLATDVLKPAYSGTYHAGQDVRHLAGEFEDDHRGGDGVRDAARQRGRPHDGVPPGHDGMPLQPRREPHRHRLPYQPPERRT